MMNELNEATDFLKSKIKAVPKVGIVLGSGLGHLVNAMICETEIEYNSIPHFPVSTVKGHGGKLAFGKLGDKDCMIMQGRFHYYEGYSMEEVVFPIRVMKLLGVETVFITNASGGLNPEIKIGELCVITDHINLQPEHPLRGKNFDELGPRFPDQHSLYNRELIVAAKKIATENKIVCHTGVYVGVQGPTFETPAEYKFMRMIGGDCVGMSTVPEVMVANHMSMKIFCISVICDEGNPPVPQQVTHDEVVKAAAAAEPKMSLIIKELISGL